jgi:hypothetical protein
MATEKFKTYALIGLTLTLVGVGFVVLTNQKKTEVHPALVPVNVSTNKDKPDYKSSYEQNQVRNTILKNNKSVQECYLKHLEEKDSVTSGKVQVDWQISPDGTVLSPQVVTSTMKSKNLEDCILARLKAFNFPPPPSDKPVYTTFTYSFRKEGESLAPMMVPFKS